MYSVRRVGSGGRLRTLRSGLVGVEDAGEPARPAKKEDGAGK